MFITQMFYLQLISYPKYDYRYSHVKHTTLVALYFKKGEC